MLVEQLLHLNLVKPCLLKPKNVVGKILDSRVGYYGTKLVQGIGVEGYYEENIQLAISRYNEGSGKYKGFLNQWYNQTIDAIKGDDTEAAMNIGLGGIMGGFFGAGTSIARSEYAKTREFSEKLLNNINNAQQNMIKSGDVFEKDADGKYIMENGKPKVDVAKLIAFQMVTNNVHGAVLAAQTAEDNDKATSLVNLAKKEAMASWIVSMKNAGLQDEIDTKLDDLKKKSPEELAALGVTVEDKQNISQAVDEYKNYAKLLIELHDSIDADILINPDNAKVANIQQARKNNLFFQGARQIALEQESSKITTELNDVKSQLNKIGSDISDSFVEKHNHLVDRIDSQEKMLSAIDGYIEDGSDINKQEEEQNLEELKKEKTKLEEDNKDIIEGLDKENNKYKYQISDKNKALLSQKAERLSKQLAAVENSTKSVNQEWYKIADIRSGLIITRRNMTEM